MKNAGFFGNSKMEMYATLPKESYPKTLFIKKNSTIEDTERLLDASEIIYPLIIKPDVGERGECLEILHDREDLMKYFRKYSFDTILQSYVNFDFECSIFCYRFDEEEPMHISSVVGKEFLAVKGDGKRTLEELIDSSKRAFLQKKSLQEKWGAAFKNIISKDKQIVLRPNANHSKGAKFYSLNHEIDIRLQEVVNEWCDEIKGFYYGRFDIRCESMKALKEKKFYKIIELNGIGAEPIDMYIPGTGVLKSWKILLSHWQAMYEISRQNAKKGLKGISDSEGWRALYEYWRFKSKN